jgi:hypothetical protein
VARHDQIAGLDLAQQRAANVGLDHRTRRLQALLREGTLEGRRQAGNACARQAIEFVIP